MIKGWDDAPVVTVETAFQPKPVTIVMPYFENPLFLAKQIYGWSRFPQELRAHLSAIIVDDCSPESPAENVVKASQSYRPFPIRLFRIDKKARWNWLAARNIAMQHASEGWCVATDMDHVIPPETIEALLFGKHDEGAIYRFSRAENTGEVIHSHPNSFFMTRAMFWKFGGYDERFAGRYGSDGDLRKRCASIAPIATLKERLIRHEYYGDSSTTKFERKRKDDRVEIARIIAERPKNWSPLVLSFAYHEVSL